jgi:hypothetical protein
MPRFRLFGNGVLSFLTKIASGYWGLSDPQNGYTAVSGEALRAIDLEGIYEYYGYCNDVLVRLSAADLRVADVAQPAKYGDEESHIDYSEYIPRVSTMLLRDFLWRLTEKRLRRDPHPLAPAYLLGGVCSAVGLLSLVRGALTDDGAGDGGRVTALGVVLLLLGMVLDWRANGDEVVRVKPDSDPDAGTGSTAADGSADGRTGSGPEGGAGNDPSDDEDDPSDDEAPAVTDGTDAGGESEPVRRTPTGDRAEFARPGKDVDRSES